MKLIFTGESGEWGVKTSMQGLGYEGNHVFNKWEQYDYKELNGEHFVVVGNHLVQIYPRMWAEAEPNSEELQLELRNLSKSRGL